MPTENAKRIGCRWWASVLSTSDSSLLLNCTLGKPSSPKETAFESITGEDPDDELLAAIPDNVAPILIGVRFLAFSSGNSSKKLPDGSSCMYLFAPLSSFCGVGATAVFAMTVSTEVES